MVEFARLESVCSSNVTEGLTADFARGENSNIREAQTAGADRGVVKAGFASANFQYLQNPEEDSAISLGGTE